MQVQKEETNVFEDIWDLITIFFEKPVPYSEYRENFVDSCKLEFGNHLRKELNKAKWHGLFYWIFGWTWLYVYAGHFFKPLDYESKLFPQMDLNFECLIRSDDPYFTRENFESEYWFQKSYIMQFADRLQANPTPRFVEKSFQEME